MLIPIQASGDIAEATLSANISNINSSMPVYWNVPSNYVNMNWVSRREFKILAFSFCSSYLLMALTL